MYIFCKIYSRRPFVHYKLHFTAHLLFLMLSVVGAVVRALDSRWADRGFNNSRPLHCRATTLGKLFTTMCLCSPSSIIWYLARAFMLTRLYVAAIGWGPMNKGSIVVAVLQRSDRLEPRYKLSTLLLLFYYWTSGGVSQTPG